MTRTTTKIPVDWTDQRELAGPVAMVFNLQAETTQDGEWLEAEAGALEAARIAAARNQLDMFPDAEGARRVTT